MIGLLVVVYDKLSKMYSAPVLTENENTAKRWFASVVRVKGDDASDYELYSVGDFDTSEGKILNNRLDLVQKGVDYIEK